MTPDHEPARKSLESERAELADQLDACVTRSGGIDLRDPELLRRAASALRSLAAQDQKPVAWGNGDELDNMLDDGTATVAGVRDGYRNTPLYLSPPPDAGWDEAIEACKKVALSKQKSVSQFSVAVDIANAIEALRNNAPTDSGAGKSDDTNADLRQLTEIEQDCINKALLDSGTVVGSLPDHGGADAGVRPCPFCGKPPVLLATTESDSFIRCYELRCDNCGIGLSEEYKTNTIELWNTRALSHQPAPVAANASAEADHNPEDSAYWNRRAELGNASAEARLRENQGELYLRRDEVRKILIEQPEENLDVTEGVLADIDDLTAITRLEIRYPAVVKDFLWTVIRAYYNNAWSSNREHIVSRANELFEALSAHPHASDCDKQGER